MSSTDFPEDEGDRVESGDEDEDEGDAPEAHGTPAAFAGGAGAGAGAGARDDMEVVPPRPEAAVRTPTPAFAAAAAAAPARTPVIDPSLRASFAYTAPVAGPIPAPAPAQAQAPAGVVVSVPAAALAPAFAPAAAAPFVARVPSMSGAFPAVGAAAAAPAQFRAPAPAAAPAAPAEAKKKSAFQVHLEQKHMREKGTFMNSFAILDGKLSAPAIAMSNVRGDIGLKYDLKQDEVNPETLVSRDQIENLKQWLNHAKQASEHFCASPFDFKDTCGFLRSFHHWMTIHPDPLMRQNPSSILCDSKSWNKTGPCEFHCGARSSIPMSVVGARNFSDHVNTSLKNLSGYTVFSHVWTHNFFCALTTDMNSAKPGSNTVPLEILLSHVTNDRDRVGGKSFTTNWLSSGHGLQVPRECSFIDYDKSLVGNTYDRKALMHRAMRAHFKMLASANTTATATAPAQNLLAAAQQMYTLNPEQKLSNEAKKQQFRAVDAYLPANMRGFAKYEFDNQCVDALLHFIHRVVTHSPTTRRKFFESRTPSGSVGENMELEKRSMGKNGLLSGTMPINYEVAAVSAEVVRVDVQLTPLPPMSFNIQLDDPTFASSVTFADTWVDGVGLMARENKFVYEWCLAPSRCLKSLDRKQTRVIKKLDLKEGDSVSGLVTSIYVKRTAVGEKTRDKYYVELFYEQKRTDLGVASVNAFQYMRIPVKLGKTPSVLQMEPKKKPFDYASCVKFGARHVSMAEEDVVKQLFTLIRQAYPWLRFEVMPRHTMTDFGNGQGRCFYLHSKWHKAIQNKNVAEATTIITGLLTALNVTPGVALPV